MIGNKYTGDSIATEFMKIMGSRTSPGETLEKSASVENDLAEVAEDMLMESADEQPASDPIESALEAVENMLGDSEGKSEDSDNALDAGLAPSADNSFDAHAAFTDSETYLIKGLGKIAGGLRRKSESFAADMVEATARSIYSDIAKEASHRNDVMQNLSKIANDLKASGDNFASDLVSGISS